MWIMFSRVVTRLAHSAMAEARGSAVVMSVETSAFVTAALGATIYRL
jgi:hypothetical protein